MCDTENSQTNGVSFAANDIFNGETSEAHRGSVEV